MSENSRGFVSALLEAILNNTRAVESLAAAIKADTGAMIYNSIVLSANNQELKAMSVTMTNAAADQQAALANLATAITGAVTLFQQLAEQVSAAAGDAAATEAAAVQINAAAKTLSDAAAAVAPAAPPAPAPAPAPAPDATTPPADVTEPATP